MNIFASYPSPIKSAEYLDDKRVIKMILESAQLLSTAINECGGKGPYRSTHKNHPVAKWCRETKSNYNWLLTHFVYLLSEYNQRYNKTHACDAMFKDLMMGEHLMPKGELTAFPNCTTFKDEKDVHLAYKLYLNHKWANDKRKPTWYKREKDV